MFKNRIAFIGVGILKPNSQSGIPAFLILLDNLSSKFDLTLYRLTKDQVSAGKFKVRSLPFSFFPDRVNYLFIIALFIFDHLKKRYSVINALAAQPAGRIAILVGKIFKIPVILHLHAAEIVSLKDINYGDINSPKAKKKTGQVLRNSSIITLLSSYQKEILVNTYGPQLSTLVINHGCDTNFFNFKSKNIGVPLKLLYVGYNEKVKNPEGALTVYSMLKKENISVQLSMIGKGLSKAFGSLSGSQEITFIESVPYDKMPSYFHDADILLITSHYESQSSVAIEAMACGTLVCGTHVGILDDLSDYACITTAPGDYPGLAQKIIALLKDFNKQLLLRQNARKWAVAHDHHWTASQYEKIFHTL